MPYTLRKIVRKYNIGYYYIQPRTKKVIKEIEDLNYKEDGNTLFI